MTTGEYPEPEDYMRAVRAMSGDDLLREAVMNLMGLRVEMTYLRGLVQGMVGEGPDRLIVNVYNTAVDELPN